MLVAYNNKRNRVWHITLYIGLCTTHMYIEIYTSLLLLYLGHLLSYSYFLNQPTRWLKIASRKSKEKKKNKNSQYIKGTERITNEHILYKTRTTHHCKDATLDEIKYSEAGGTHLQRENRPYYTVQLVYGSLSILCTQRA